MNFSEQTDLSGEITGTPGVGSSVPSYAWKSAYGVLAAMALTIPPGIGFFLYGGVFGPLSDAGALLVGLLLAPLVWSIHLLYGDADRNGAVFGLGAVAVAGICLGSFGLVAMSLLSISPEIYAATLLGVQFLGWILLGFWLLGVGLLGQRIDAVSKRTAWTAIIAGIGIAGVIVTLVYSYAVGSFTLLVPLFMLGFIIGFLLWAFWIGGELRMLARSTSVQAER